MFSKVKGGAFKLHDGKLMPLVGLGTYGLFDQDQVDTAVDAALSEGYRLFDTAKFYRNEKELGNAFKVSHFCSFFRAPCTQFSSHFRSSYPSTI
jgi:diketogulonate reductase-like aldo/keto reductase